MDAEYDVVVVGAGPAGSVTAKFAAKNGADVLLIEKRQEIGSPVRCGEGIAKHFLEECEIERSHRWLAWEVEGANIISPSGYEFRISERYAGQEVGMVIERDQFDKTLAWDAAKAGADIWVKATAIGLHKEGGAVTGVKIRRMDETVDVRAGCVVGADGFESQVGRWGGINTVLKTSGLTAALQYRMVNIEPDPDSCEFYLGSVAPAGYIWVFPKGEGIANVGIGMQWTRLKGKADLRRRLDRWIAKQDRYRDGQPLDMVAGGLSTCAPIDKTVGNGLLLVGDAARQTDPITGGGIANGCRAGRVAGEVLARAVEEGDFSEQSLNRYEVGWRAILEEGLWRDWMAKNKLVTLSDGTFDTVIKSLGEVGLEKLSVHNILKVVRDEHPELVKEFEDLI